MDGAGIPLLDGLQDLAQHSRSPILTAILGRIGDEVSQGRRLSDALESHTRLFPPVETQVFRAGEISGELEHVNLVL